MWRELKFIIKIHKLRPKLIGDARVWKILGYMNKINNITYRNGDIIIQKDERRVNAS